jgi:hypothetical protein
MCPTHYPARAPRHETGFSDSLKICCNEKTARSFKTAQEGEHMLDLTDDGLAVFRDNDTRSLLWNQLTLLHVCQMPS